MFCNLTSQHSCAQNTSISVDLPCQQEDWTFENYLLTCGPAAVIYVLAPFYVPRKEKWMKSVQQIPHNFTNVTKTIIAVLLAAVYFVEFLHQGDLNFHQSECFEPDYLRLSLQLTSMFLAVYLIQNDRQNGKSTNGGVAMYWCLLCVCSTVTMATKFLQKLEPWDTFMMQLRATSIILVFIECVFALFCVDKSNKNGSTADKDQNPEDEASCISKATFWWHTGMIKKGCAKPLEKEDLWQLTENNKSENLLSSFKAEWMRQERTKTNKNIVPEESVDLLDETDHEKPIERTGKTTKKPNLVWTLIRTFYRLFFVSFFFRIHGIVLELTKPLILKALIGFIEDKNQPMWMGYMYAVFLFAVCLAECIVNHQFGFRSFENGEKIRMAVTSAVYRKSLCLSNKSRKSKTVGEIVNLMSVDAGRLTGVVDNFACIGTFPLKVFSAMYFLYLIFGPITFLGVAVFLIFVPISGYMITVAKGFQTQQMKYKDERIKLMNEILNGIKVLKLYAWEMSFKEKILAIRNLELDVLRKGANRHSVNGFMWKCAPCLMSVSIFAGYVLMSTDNILDAKKAFVALTYLDIIRHPIMAMPHRISYLTEVSVSIKRLQKFLIEDELDSSVIRSKENNRAIEVVEADFSWDHDSKKKTLKNINMEVSQGQLVAVVGTVGSGKSSLLSAILGEMETQHGTVTVNGSVAYVAQQAWIQNVTLKDNILFGHEEETTRYKKVISDCALEDDLDLLPAGDETEIGEKGINLSGGQKQRVSLARAVYTGADIYMFDDPLSAVDACTGKHIFEHVIGNSGSLKDKTRILVTHGISYLSKVDKIFVLVEGVISEVGSYQELLNKGGAFSEFINSYTNDDKTETTDIDPSIEVIPTSKCSANDK